MEVFIVGKSCKLCDNIFSSTESLIQHIRSQHVGKLSDESIEYLLSQGLSPDRIIEFCRRNKIKVNKSKVYRIALKLVKNEEEK